MGIYTTLTCFQTFRPQKRGFLETGFRLCLVTMSHANGWTRQETLSEPHSHKATITS